ncbi:alginate O-acetyltransferase AlgX-related protein [Deinococcus hopiensis]|uniref:Alginate O-acetyltransferase complex protein AlgJ n=1 Tax=Deinococcus hopiensis KR-140 TaxID=695939 RepID=A0A1W1UHH2_9DEIO|nr:hypothetical protein [Deinococcus hopiensis]SMB80555.1 alginate O-acetyltransferase complex protein AlgJ [Deinococcus hopiensis KR-140]
MTDFAQDTLGLRATRPSASRLQTWLPGAFLLTVVALGSGLTLGRPGLREAQPGKNLLTGEWTASWEKNLDAGVLWRDPSVNLWGGLNYRLLHEAREGAVMGREGWLYTAEEFQTSAQDARELAAKLEYVRQVRDTLAKTGTRLVVALIPAKARVYPEYLGRAHIPAVKENVYAQFRQELEDAHIPVPDLLAAMQAGKKRSGEALFLRTDTHWTPQGAAVAAQALAPTVEALRLDLPSATYAVQPQPPAARRGDLLRYVPVPGDVGPAPDTVRGQSYVRTDGEGGSLLGDEAIAVTLVGTSYSADTPENVWKFSGALAHALGTEVLNAAQAGKGPLLPMREYLGGQDYRDAPPKVVIWEIPERFLRVPYGNTARKE